MVFNKNKFLNAFKKKYSDTVDRAVDTGELSSNKAKRLTDGLEEEEFEAESRWAEEVVNELIEEDVEVGGLEI